MAHQSYRKKQIRVYALKYFAVMLALLLSLSVVACKGNQSDHDNPGKTEPRQDTSEQPKKTTDGKASPDVTTPEKLAAFDFELMDQHGKKQTLADYRGKVVLLHFWATWCPPCREELPHLHQLYLDHHENSDDLIILTVVIPSSGGEETAHREKTVDELKDYLKEKQLTFPVLMDMDGKIATLYRVSGMPTSFFIDREGSFIGYVPGAMTREVMDEFVRQALATSP